MSKKELTAKVIKEWADKGLIIEGGWRGLEALLLSKAPQAQRTEMRKAFFCGAQHLFASIMEIMEPGSEPVEKDLQRIRLIHKELEAFFKTMEQEGESQSLSE